MFGGFGCWGEWIFLPLVGCQAMRPANEQIKLCACESKLLRPVYRDLYVPAF